ncbi:MAG: adenine phosphoribosyltransferase [Actinomycetota bacterium]
MTVDLTAHIRDVPDFPQPGIVFKDITPLLAVPDAFRHAVRSIADTLDGLAVTKVAGIEARGFVLAAPVAIELGAGFVPVRKKGKLPWETVGVSYDLEYGSETVEVHTDCVTEGERIAVVDDVLATGGTARATVDLLRGQGAEVVACSFLITLGFLDGRSRLTDVRVHQVLEL